MIKYVMDKWNENKLCLLEAIEEKVNLDERMWDYEELLTLIIKNVLNKDRGFLDYEWSEDITTVDNGDYQGTLLFLFPQKVYQPSERGYLMTYVGYGSCSGCDALLAAGENSNKEDKIKDYMRICQDLVCNMIKPYNFGWRQREDFAPIEN